MEISLELNSANSQWKKVRLKKIKIITKNSLFRLRHKKL